MPTPHGKPVCRKCDSLRVFYRPKDHTLVCRDCGHRMGRSFDGLERLWQRDQTVEERSSGYTKT